MSSNVSKPEHITIRRYWLRDDEPALGYGVHRSFYRITAVAGALLLCSVLSVIITHASHVGFMIGDVVILLALSLILGSSFLFNGWYEVDESGNPVVFLSRMPLPGIGLVSSVNRKKFLARIKE